MSFSRLDARPLDALKPVPPCTVRLLPKVSAQAALRQAGALWVALALATGVGWCEPAQAAKGAKAASAALPVVNLVIEVRVVDEAHAGGHADYTVSTLGPPQQPLEALQLQLANGQTGAVRLGRALPVQWLQGALRGGAPAASGTFSSASAAADRAVAVAYAVTWVPSGRTLSVRPHWPGGDSPVTLELDFNSTALQAAPGTSLPATRTQQAGSTLRVPLGIWTAFAATGVAREAAGTGRVSTLTLAERGRQLMQVRVTLP
jgi:hypothetical protein